MTLYSGSQQSVVAPNLAMPGDYYGTPPYNPTNGFQASGSIQVATFVWGIDNTNQVTQAKGSNTQIAGFVVRGMDVPFAYSQTLPGYSFTISSGLIVPVNVVNASLYAAVTSLNDGGTVNLGDGVYTNDVTGVVEVSTSSPGSGHSATGYIVVKADVTNNLGLVMVVMSNIQQFVA